MTDPCKQEVIIKEIKEEASQAKDKLHEMEVRQVEIQGDVKHIKTRLDNGMSHTLSSVHSMMLKLEPVIGHHADIIKRIEGIGWTLATSILLALIAYLGWGISHGFKLP